MFPGAFWRRIVDGVAVVSSGATQFITSVAAMASGVVTVARRTGKIVFSASAGVPSVVRNTGKGIKSTAVGVATNTADGPLTLIYNLLQPAGSAISSIVVLGPTPTFTRASTGWYFDENGLLVSATTNNPRFNHNFAGTALGLLMENAATNSALQSRDMTNAAWTKTNITAAKDATGLDGSANSASTLTGTAANGTCLQSITLGSAARTFSVYVRRKTGTGNIDITDDNGTTWTTVTGLSAIDFTRYEITRTQANPIVGLRIVASGDEVEVDIAQLETQAWASSPIVTTTVAVTRASDFCTISDITWSADQVGTFYIDVIPQSTVGSIMGLFAFNDGSGNNRVDLRQSGTGGACFVSVAAVTQVNITTTSKFTTNISTKCAIAYATNDYEIIFNGSSPNTDVVCTIPAKAVLTQCVIGSLDASGNRFNGNILEFKYYSVRKSSAFIAALTA